MAPPTFLGVLRSVVDSAVQERLVGELAKDLTSVSQADLAVHLAEWLVS